MIVVVTRSSMPGAAWRSHGTAFYLLHTTLVVVITVPVAAQPRADRRVGTVSGVTLDVRIR